MIVGSLFSKRPRVTGSNCRTSCLGGVTDFSAGRYEWVSPVVRSRWVFPVMPLQPRQVLRMEPFPREVERRQPVLQVEFQVPLLRLRIVLEQEILRTYWSGLEVFASKLSRLLPRAN